MRSNAVELTEREKAILRYVIHQYILTASPVGSRNISKKYDLGLSPATIRNIMADLEELGYLDHPHTSAGRVPTDKGYRFYVDSLMPTPRLAKNEKELIKRSFESNFETPDKALKIASDVLSEITNQLACVTYPKFESATLDKIRLVKLSTKRLLVVITIRSGLVRTITLELNSNVESDKLESVQKILNERLSGLTFHEIRKTLPKRLKGKRDKDVEPIIRLFLDSSDKIFSNIPGEEKAFISGVSRVVHQPEFADHEKVESIIELIENKDVIVHFIDETFSGKKKLSIAIGGETNEKRFEEYSLIVKKYKLGEVSGALGIIGPKRMEYSKTVAAIEFIAETLSKEMKKINA
jgi:heat-inducible transcriptional repressor